MMRRALVYVDTNVFIAMLEANDDRSRALLGLFSLELKSEGAFLVTSELTLAEALVHPIRSDDARMVKVYETSIMTNPLLTVVPIDRFVLRDAAALRAASPSLKLPDAIHLGSARLAEASVVVTADTGLHSWSRSAQTVVAGNLMTFIRPNPVELNALIAELSD